MVAAPRSVRGLPGPFAAAAIPARTSRRVSVMAPDGYSSRSRPVFVMWAEDRGGPLWPSSRRPGHRRLADMLGHRADRCYPSAPRGLAVIVAASRRPMRGLAVQISDGFLAHDGPRRQRRGSACAIAASPSEEAHCPRADAAAQAEPRGQAPPQRRGAPAQQPSGGVGSTGHSACETTRTRSIVTCPSASRNRTCTPARGSPT